jgi:hypothetical protein
MFPSSAFHVLGIVACYGLSQCLKGLCPLAGDKEFEMGFLNRAFHLELQFFMNFMTGTTSRLALLSNGYWESYPQW